MSILESILDQSWASNSFYPFCPRCVLSYKMQATVYSVQSSVFLFPYSPFGPRPRPIWHVALAFQRPLPFMKGRAFMKLPLRPLRVNVRPISVHACIFLLSFTACSLSFSFHRLKRVPVPRLLMHWLGALELHPSRPPCFFHGESVGKAMYSARRGRVCHPP